MNGKSGELSGLLHSSMERFHVPGAGITLFQENRLNRQMSLGIEEMGTTRKVNSNSIFHACSMSKMVTAIGVLKLVQEGLLDLEEDTNTYLKSWQIPESLYLKTKKVTISSLLAHQSGFIDPAGSFEVLQNNTPFPALKELLSGRTPYNAESSVVKYTPETEFHYSDTGYTILELLIEDITGEPFSSAIKKLVIEPLGLEQTFFWNGASTPMIAKGGSLTSGHDKHGKVIAGTRAHYPNLSGTGLWTTPFEISLITKEIIKSFDGDPASLLSPELTRKMLTGYSSAQFAGLGVFLSKAKEEPYMMSKGWGVGYQCMLIAYPRLRCGMVIMTNSEPGKPQEEAFIGEAIQFISEEYDWPGL
ncbi:serine hydrolase domain-containing protein [Paenibacillus jiagnxiensis]|uniref:serine hydrolase domain-containing protein n=1 Tax=Paenibacillus jiagnxiensis TaxID=3228926 RepID=UPI0033A39513